MWGVICSLLIMIPFYAFLIAIMIGTDTYKMVLLVGIVAVIQTIATIMSNFGGLWGGIL